MFITHLPHLRASVLPSEAFSQTLCKAISFPLILQVSPKCLKPPLGKLHPLPNCSPSLHSISCLLVITTCTNPFIWLPLALPTKIQASRARGKLCCGRPQGNAQHEAHSNIWKWPGCLIYSCRCSVFNNTASRSNSELLSYITSKTFLQVRSSQATLLLSENVLQCLFL